MARMKRLEVFKNILPRLPPRGTHEDEHIPVSRCQEDFNEDSIAVVSSARYVPDHPCSGQALLIGCCCIPNAWIGIVEQAGFSY